MTNWHLATGVHYRLSITVPSGELYAAHVMLHEADVLMITEFIKDSERIDEVNEVVDLAAQWRFEDAIPPAPPGQHKEFIWDWNELRWVGSDEHITPDTDLPALPF